MVEIGGGRIRTHDSKGPTLLIPDGAEFSMPFLIEGLVV